MKTIEYTPRRANKKRWLADAPEYILDCFNFPNDGGPEVLFTGSMLGRIYKDADKKEVYTDRTHTYIFGLGNQGSFELQPHQAANFRYAKGKKRVRWTDLPEDFRDRVKAWAEQD